jgi:hypothetical protein
MHKKIMLIFLILFSMTACVTKGHEMKVTHEVVRPDGSPFPDPLYVLQTVDSRVPIRVSFYFSSFKMKEDIDGIRVPTEKFLSVKSVPTFSSKDGDKAQMVVRVLNPRNVRYKVFCKQRIGFSDGGSTEMYSHIAYSDMKYRQYDRELPVKDGISEVLYSIQITDEAGNLLISTGNFHYFVN